LKSVYLSNYLTKIQKGFGPKMKGSVKMFNKEKGYGFIRTEDGKDVFFHYSSLLMDSYKVAEVGEKVEFDVEESERGPRATNIRKVA
jgi:cold shock protein